MTDQARDILSRFIATALWACAILLLALIILPTQARAEDRGDDRIECPIPGWTTVGGVEDCVPPKGDPEPEPCERGYFRIDGEGDCMKKTCENGGLGKEDCRKDEPEPDPPKDDPEGTPPLACDARDGTKRIGRFLFSGGITWTDGAYEEWRWAEFNRGNDTLYTVKLGDCDCGTATIKVRYACSPELKKPSVRFTFSPSLIYPLMEWEILDAPAMQTNRYRKPAGSLDVEKFSGYDDEGNEVWAGLYLGRHDWKGFECHALVD